MENRRRKFLKESSFIALGTAILPFGCSSSEKSASEKVAEISEEIAQQIGVQVYSVRDALKQNFNETIAKVAKIGYSYIEGYGLGADGLNLRN